MLEVLFPIYFYTKIDDSNFFEISSVPLILPIVLFVNNWGKGKKGLYCGTAKFYLPRRAVAAADRALRLPQCTSRNARDGI